MPLLHGRRHKARGEARGSRRHQQHGADYEDARTGLVPGAHAGEDKKFRIVDTVKWMVPESDQSALPPYRYVIHLGSSGWAIGCHELTSSEKVDGESVKWRETPGQRPWLAGIVKTKCVSCSMLRSWSSFLSRVLI